MERAPGLEPRFPPWSGSVLLGPRALIVSSAKYRSCRLRGGYEPPLTAQRGEPSIRGRGSPIQSDDPSGRPSARTMLVRSDFMTGFRIGCHTVYGRAPDPSSPLCTQWPCRENTCVCGFWLSDSDLAGKKHQATFSVVKFFRLILRFGPHVGARVVRQQLSGLAGTGAVTGPVALPLRKSARAVDRKVEDFLFWALDRGSKMRSLCGGGSDGRAKKDDSH
jgi:hypothetical protein